MVVVSAVCEMGSWVPSHPAWLLRLIKLLSNICGWAGLGNYNWLGSERPQVRTNIDWRVLSSTSITSITCNDL